MTNQELQSLKNKYDIIGNDPALNRALEIAVAVAPTDITVLVSGESGVGKENIPRIIHQNSHRKRGKYFAINCGAIPEGTIDSELFGHEKGSFTGANEMRRGYFEEAYLVLKSNAAHPAPIPADLAAEADRIIREACGNCRIGRREPYLAGRGLAFALGAASSSALIGAVALLITVV
jgi:hypothetical protein